MAMGQISVASPVRRDRLWLLNALANMLLTVLGAAGEALGYDRMLYELIPNMPEARLAPLTEKIAEMVAGVKAFTDTFGIV